MLVCSVFHILMHTFYSEFTDIFVLFQVKIELFDDGDEVAEFEFDADLLNQTAFFSPLHLKRSSYDDIPIGIPFNGDGFSFDGYVHGFLKLGYRILKIF